MSSSLQKKVEPQVRLVSDEDAVAFPENARPTDDTPTVISKTTPISEPQPSNNQDKIVDLTRKPATPESIVAGLRGRRLAHYELIEPIGVGGMAAVIRARDTQLDRFVALKILPPEMAQEPDNVQRFHQEAKAAAKLDHDNIARVFYCGEEQGLYFIAFEFVEGMNLRTLMEKRGRIPVAESIGYILQIAAGLEHAATRGVVHRDVKPSNIIITPHGQAKLVDMGLARNLERHGERDLTQSGVTLGTFDYISPEQALEPREADSRSDIYSLGCTLYHMLTGVPPVPEGTPAKKLQHHQNHAPTDPRQYNPEIPDEIVKILGKMMEKNPRDRYQRPNHLVQHLLQVAKQIGVGDGLPDGALFVDASLPNRPRSSPVLMVGLALAALVVVTLLLRFAPEPVRTAKGPIVAPGYDAKGTQPTLDKKIVDPKPDPTETAAQLETVQDRKDLEQVLASSAKVIKAKINAPVAIEIEGLVFKGTADQRLELESDDAENNIIRFHFQKIDAPPVGLVLEGGAEVVFRRIKFQIEAGTTPNQAIAALAIRGVKSVKFEHCIFVQLNVPAMPSYSPLSQPRVPVASILIDAPDDAIHSRPKVTLTDCYFDSDSSSGGQIAVAINGAATVNVMNGAFKPHGAFFQLREKCSQERTSLELRNCAAFVVRGPAFRFNKGASAHVRVEHSVFSRPEGNTVIQSEDLPQSGLIYLASEALVRYEGQANIYHNLNALVERKKELIRDPEDFKIFVAENKGSDRASLNPTGSPLEHLKPLEILNNKMAFQLKAEYHGKYGLSNSWSGPIPPPILVEKTPPSPVMKIVDADTRTPGEFRNLRGALALAVDGDVIFIKHGKSREVVVSPVTLNPGTVTLKPYKDCQPILVMDKEVPENDAALFKMQKGTLRIENMELLLDPLAGYETRSAVHLGEGAHLVFDKCVFTLRATNSVELSVVTFLDLGMMKLDSPSPFSSRAEFHDCLVRGKGDLVALRGCRKLNVEITNSLIALDGSLLDIQSAEKMMPINQGVHWKMSRSSIFTTESIFALRSNTGKGLTQTIAKIDGCLLASLTPDQPVIYKVKSDDLEKYLMWKGDQNFYANYDKTRIGDWREQFPETRSVSGELTFPKLNDELLKTLWDVTPDSFVPTDAEQRKSITGFGMPPEAEKGLLPPAPLPDPGD